MRWRRTSGCRAQKQRELEGAAASERCGRECEGRVCGREGGHAREAREEGDCEPDALVKESEPKGGDSEHYTKQRKKAKLLDRVFSDVFLFFLPNRSFKMYSISK